MRVKEIWINAIDPTIMGSSSAYRVAASSRPVTELSQFLTYYISLDIYSSMVAPHLSCSEENVVSYLHLYFPLKETGISETPQYQNATI